MPTFEVPKDFNDIEAPQLIPAGYILAEIANDPELRKNKAWRDAGESLDLAAAQQIDEKASWNLSFQIKTISDTPEYNGRTFFKHLGLPTEADKQRYHGMTGQCMEDWKMDQIMAWVLAFGGTIEGTSFSITKGMRAQIYVAVVKDDDGMDQNELPLEPLPRTADGGAVKSAGGGPEGDVPNPFEN